MENLPPGHSKANCPSCGAEIVFASSVSVFAVCSHCRTMLVRHDMDLESLGTMAQLPDDVSPFRIGTRGKLGRDRFTLIGRLKVAWSEGYWNEWFLRFEDGRHGWLAEAMGFLMLSFEEKDASAVPARSKLAVGDAYALARGLSFTVHDLRDAECVASEGELPFRAPSGRRTTSVDLRGSGGAFANIEYSADDGVRLYVGRYVTYDEIDWSNLRDLGTALKKARAAEQFKCPSCGGPISLRTPGHTAAVVCSYCGSTIDATNRHLAVLHKAEKKMKIKPLIPIGAKGVLSGTQWEVTGFMRRTDGSGEYPWDEYLLFNPYRGFRWLTTADGHWNFVEMLHEGPPARGIEDRFEFEGRPFRKFLSGTAKVAYVLGEFYWRVKKGDEVAVADFIAPPEILSREADGSEIVWSRGHYLDRSEVQDAFRLPGEMPAREGVAPNQPSPAGTNVLGVMKTFAAFAVALTVLQGVFVARAMDREIYSDVFTFDPAVMPHKAFSTPSFELPGYMENVETYFQAPVSNDWMEASVSLVNETTQQSIDFEQGVEYYFGSDSDGPWTEGRDTTRTFLSSVPGGRYHLVIQPTPSSATTQARKFTIQVRRDVPMWCNYFLALFLLGLYPLCAGIRHHAFEVKRWSTSDFSPYPSAGDDEGE